MLRSQNGDQFIILGDAPLQQAGQGGNTAGEGLLQGVNVRVNALAVRLEVANLHGMLPDIGDNVLLRKPISQGCPDTQKQDVGENVFPEDRTCSHRWYRFVVDCYRRVHSATVIAFENALEVVDPRCFVTM